MRPERTKTATQIVMYTAAHLLLCALITLPCGLCLWYAGANAELVLTLCQIALPLLCALLTPYPFGRRGVPPLMACIPPTLAYLCVPPLLGARPLFALMAVMPVLSAVSACAGQERRRRAEKETKRTVKRT